MPEPTLFLESSALVAGAASPAGAARALLVLGEVGRISLLVSEQVVSESEHVLARKLPSALPGFRQALLAARVSIVRDPSREEVAAHPGLIAHAPDGPILLAAMKAGAAYLVTFNRRHFADDPSVALRAGLLIGSPGGALAWLRAAWADEGGGTRS